MEILEEKQLIQEAKSGDSQSFILIYRKYYPQIYSYILKRTGNIQVAEDITSETFFKVLDNIAKFEWREVALSSWIYKIASNEINRYFSKHSSKTVSFDLLYEKGFDIKAEDDPENQLIESQDNLEDYHNFKVIQKILTQLPTKYSEVISLKYFENKKISEISEILNKSEGTVKSLLSRGRDKLIEKIDQEGLSLQPFSEKRVIE